jgi:N-acetylglucosaminyl-diphospho-decaprenol L-rhamnosyltransferase
VILSVVIVSWNVRDVLQTCLESLRPEWERTWAEVIVVDNASTDGTPDLVRDHYPAVRLIANAANRGFGAANNQGMTAAGGRYLLLLNPDTVVLPGALEALVAFIEAHPRVGLVAPRLLNPDGSLQRNAFHFPGLVQVALDLFPVHPRLMESALNGRYGREPHAKGPFMIDHPLGAAMLVRREVWEETGGFDEDYFMYAEEVDWCRRIHQAGWTIWQVPAAEIVHYGGQSTRQMPDSMFIELWRARYRFFRRYHGPLYQAVVRLLVRLGMLWRTWKVSRAAAQGDLDPATAHARRRAAATIFRF